jgi:formate dehydrogenase subunit gamma
MAISEPTPAVHAPEATKPHVGDVVVFADTDALREAYREILERASLRTKLVDRISALDAVPEGSADKPSVFVIDVMPDTADVQGLGDRIKNRHPGARVVLVTERLQVHEAREMMWDGIDDVLLKPLDPGELVEAVLHAKEVSFSPAFKPDAQVLVEKMDLSSRVQHMVLIACFALLCLSGFPLLFPQSRWFETIFFFTSSSFELRAGLHRFAAVFLIALSGYHAYYIAFTQRGRENFRHILPGWKDLRDFLGTVKYNLGMRQDLPDYPKFDVFEKMEYLGAFWGNFIMILTGALLWRKDWTLRFAPLWFFDVVRVVHRYEAILALAFILIWHMYCVHLRPGQFPMGRTFLNGKISLEEMKHRHRGWYKQYVKEQLGAQAPRKD